MNKKVLNEAKNIFVIAFPIIVASVSHLLMGFTDNVMAGRYSSVDLAGVSLGSAIWLPVTLFFMAILSSATPLMSTSIGRDGGKGNSEIFKTGLFLAALIGLILIFIINLSTLLLKIFIKENKTAEITKNYLIFVSFAIPGFLIYQVIRSVFESIGKTAPIMISSFIGMLLNIPLNYIFIYGKLGVKPFGGSGCGIATSISTYVMLILLLLILKKAQILKKGKLSKEKIKQIIKLGLPIGAATFLEAFIFSFGSIMLAPLGTITVASHQIALNFISTIFMIPMSLGIAISVRVSHKYGENDLLYSATVWKIGIGMVLSIALFSSILMYLMIDKIIGFYTKDPNLIYNTKPLMMLAISFHIIDAFQVAANNALKGYHNTKYPMWISLFSYWIIALPLSYILVYIFNLAAIGFWIALIVGIVIAAGLLGYKLIKDYNFKNL